MPSREFPLEIMRFCYFQSIFWQSFKSQFSEYTAFMKLYSTVHFTTEEPSIKNVFEKKLHLLDIQVLGSFPGCKWVFFIYSTINIRKQYNDSNKVMV